MKKDTVNYESNYNELNYDEFNDYKQLEYDLFDGESFHYLTILYVNKDKNEITLVIQHQGKISTNTYDLYEEFDNGIYFEYGPTYKKIYLEDFEVEAC